MSPPIREPLTFNAKQGRFCSANIVNTEPDTVVVAELELGQVAAQVFLVAVLIDALHATLEQAEVAFDSVGVDRGILKRDVLAYAVVDRVVAGKLPGSTHEGL